MNASKSPETNLNKISAVQNPAHSMLRFQPSDRNKAVRQLVQTKLTIGKPEDKYEQEADRVADAVLRMPGSLQAKGLERKNPAESRGAHGGLPMQSGGGAPLPASVRSFFEPRFGRSFEDVRIHTGSKAAKSAKALNARAFTTGRGITFGAGEYSPGTLEGRKLIAHELTHVVQQRDRMISLKPSKEKVEKDQKRIPKKASNIKEYIELVKLAETAFPQYSPREMLSLLRKIYYGSEEWSHSRDDNWDMVTPSDLNFKGPQGAYEQELFQALKGSQVVSGMDIGHVFTGLEAMITPSESVTLKRFLLQLNVKISNEAFATWGGDLGSAAAKKLSDKWNGEEHGWEYYFGEKTLKDPKYNPSLEASYVDLEGDIDSYVIKNNLLGSNAKVTVSKPVSEILKEYYVDTASPLNKSKRNTYVEFARAIGAEVTGDRITNKSLLRRSIAVRVFAFSEIWFMKLRSYIFFYGKGAWLLKYSYEITDLFLDWVERKMKKGD